MSNSVNFRWQGASGQIYGITINDTVATVVTIDGRETNADSTLTVNAGVHDNIKDGTYHISRLYWDTILSGSNSLSDVLS